MRKLRTFTIDGLVNTEITNPQSGDILQWDGVNYVNVPSDPTPQSAGKVSPYLMDGVTSYIDIVASNMPMNFGTDSVLGVQVVSGAPLSGISEYMAQVSVNDGEASQTSHTFRYDTANDLRFLIYTRKNGGVGHNAISPTKTIAGTGQYPLAEGDWLWFTRKHSENREYLVHCSADGLRQSTSNRWNLHSTGDTTAVLDRIRLGRFDRDSDTVYRPGSYCAVAWSNTLLSNEEMIAISTASNPQLASGFSKLDGFALLDQTNPTLLAGSGSITIN